MHPDRRACALPSLQRLSHVRGLVSQDDGQLLCQALGSRRGFKDSAEHRISTGHEESAAELTTVKGFGSCPEPNEHQQLSNHNPCRKRGRERKERQMPSPEPVNPIQVQKFLGGIDYPTDKQTLLRTAEQ